MATIIVLIKISPVNLGGVFLWMELWEMHAQSGSRDSQPSESPGNLENMPCGLAVIALAQTEARPQPIW